MSPCRFQYDFPGEADALVETIREHVSRAGGSFSGSTDAGTFALSTPIGRFLGTYAIDGQTLFLEVEKRPFFVPCRAIETRLTEYIRGAF